MLIKTCGCPLIGLKSRLGQFCSQMIVQQHFKCQSNDLLRLSVHSFQLSANDKINSFKCQGRDWGWYGIVWYCMG